MKLACPHCFEPFDLDEAVARFDSNYIGSAEWKYYDVFPTERLCFDCAETEADSRWMKGELAAADGPPPSADELKDAWRNVGKKLGW